LQVKSITDSSKIWQLCKKVIPFMIQNTSKVPMGGASINIGADKILGQQPTNMHEETIPILNFFNNRGIHHLDQIFFMHICRLSSTVKLPLRRMRGMVFIGI